MRGLVLGISALGLMALVAVGCGDSEGDDGSGASAGHSTSGSSGAATAGTGGSSAGKAGSTGAGGSSSGAAGKPGTAGNSQGGTPGNGGSANAAGETGNGGEPASGGAGAFVNCDIRKVTCEMGPPKCPANQTASVDGLCYGECVLVSRCACKTADECPNPNEYTCWMQQHCGPFVK